VKCLVFDRVDDIQQPVQTTKTKNDNMAENSSEPQEQCNWGRYARGAVYALQNRGHNISKVRDNTTMIHLSVYPLGSSFR